MDDQRSEETFADSADVLQEFTSPALDADPEPRQRKGAPGRRVGQDARSDVAVPDGEKAVSRSGPA